MSNLDFFIVLVEPSDSGVTLLLSESCCAWALLKRYHSHTTLRFYGVGCYWSEKYFLNSRITLNELVTSGKGGTVVGMLTDLDAFLEYENREDAIYHE